MDSKKLVGWDCRTFDVIAVNFRGEFETCRVTNTFPNAITFKTEDSKEFSASYEDLTRTGSYYLYEFQPALPKLSLW